MITEERNIINKLVYTSANILEIRIKDNKILIRKLEKTLYSEDKIKSLKESNEKTRKCVEHIRKNFWG